MLSYCRHMYPEWPSLGALFFASIGLVFVYVVYSITSTHFSIPARFLRKQSWVGAKNQWLPGYRASRGITNNARQLILDGYSRFSKEKRPFVLPLAGTDGLMLLPPERIHSYLQLSDSEVDINAILKQNIAAAWTGDEDLGHPPIHLDVIKHQLTRKLHSLTPQVSAELILSLQDEWRVDHEWTPIAASDSCMRIISRAANRVFCGIELCG